MCRSIAQVGVHNFRVFVALSKMANAGAAAAPCQITVQVNLTLPPSATAATAAPSATAAPDEVVALRDEVDKLRDELAQLRAEHALELKTLRQEPVFVACSGGSSKFHLQPHCGGFAGNPSKALELCGTCVKRLR